MAVLANAEFESLTRWWRDAGVDLAVAETPQPWLAAPESKRHTPAPPALPTPLALPDTLDAFVAWLMTDDAVRLGGPPARRVRPDGDPQARLMVLLDMPDPEDVDAGRLLTGEVGTQFDRMLGAMNLLREQVYLASVAPGRHPTGRVPTNELDAFAEQARRHVAMVQPKLLWIIGDAVSCALLGKSVAATGRMVHELEIGGTTTRAIATVHPRLIVAEPRVHRARTWTTMQLLLPDLTS